MDGLPAVFYWPYSELKFCRSYSGAIKKNDSSHGILLGEEGGFVFNFFGDFEKRAWKEILKKNVNTKISKTDFIFKYPHHGRNSGNPIMNIKKNITAREMFRNYNQHCKNTSRNFCSTCCIELASSNNRNYFWDGVAPCWPIDKNVMYEFNCAKLLDVRTY